MNTYQCGALCVEMTAEQAERWNNGNLTDADIETIRVFLPTESRGLPTTEVIKLADAGRRLDAGDMNLSGIEDAAVLVK